jgi:hypothetical protein
MHPSLTAEFIPPPPLKPKEKMERNEPCWCGSGKKWKVCHRDRHKQEESPIGKISHEMSVAQKRGLCLHPDAGAATCANRPIKAHTIQRRGGLEAIAEEGHVISGKRGYENIFKNEGRVIPDRIGLANASTFMGFCGVHDNSLFEPIEQHHFELNDRAAFLLAYRAIAYEYLTKKNVLESIEIQRNMDKGKDFETQVYIQEYLHLFRAGLIRGMQDLEYWKREYDRRLNSGDYSDIQHYALKFDGALPFVCCGGFQPEVSFDGRQLQILTRSTEELEHVCVNVSVMNQQTFLVFAWLGGGRGPAEDFVQSFHALHDDEKANMILHLAAEHIENTYYRPSWWESIGASHQGHLIERMRSGISPSYERTPEAFVGVDRILSRVPVISEVVPGDF